MLFVNDGGTEEGGLAYGGDHGRQAAYPWLAKNPITLIDHPHRPEPIRKHSELEVLTPDFDS